MIIGSDGKASACNAGDLGSIPGLGEFIGGGHGMPCLRQSQDNAFRIPSFTRLKIKY